MAGVNVTINGRVYRLACDEGQEGHLMTLASEINKHVDGLKGNFGEIGDARLTVMAALTIADEVYELRRKVRSMEADVVAARTMQQTMAEGLASAQGAVADALIEAAIRVEKLAASMSPVTDAPGAAHS